MRFKVTFGHTGQNRLLPIDYQYYIGALIYKVLRTADPAFAHFLHQFGYSDGNKNFKLFSYSPLGLNIAGTDHHKSVFILNNGSLHLNVAFHLPDAAEKFIIGLFNNQQAYLGNRQHGCNLRVEQIERLNHIPISQVMQYRLLSPAVFSILDGKSKYARYAHPDDVDYHILVTNHLKQKLRVASGNSVRLTDPVIGNFEIVKEKGIKSKLIRVKPDKPEETKVRGFLYEFKLDAPAEVHQMIMNCGFGEKNASGFGWVEGSASLTSRIKGD